MPVKITRLLRCIARRETGQGGTEAGVNPARIAAGTASCLGKAEETLGKEIWQNHLVHRTKLRVRRKGSVLGVIVALGLFVLAIFSGCAGYTAKTNGGPPALWSAKMETGDLSQWYSSMNATVGSLGGAIENSGIASVVASTDFAHSGRYSAKLTITTPDTPTSGVRLFRWGEPEKYPQLYYSVWYYFPQSYIPFAFLERAVMEIQAHRERNGNERSLFHLGSRRDPSRRDVFLPDR